MIDKYRILRKFIYSSFGIFAGFIANIFVANHIGPEAYGQYGFIIAVTTFIVQIILVTLNETYVFCLSTNKYPMQEVNTAYILLLMLVFALCSLIFVGTISLHNLKLFFWPGIDSLYCLVAGFLYTVLLNGQQSIVKYGDCTGQYAPIEGLRFSAKLMTILFVIGFWSIGYLNLTSYFNSLLLSLTIFFILFMLKHPFPMGFQNMQSLGQVLKTMYQGWNPLSFYPVIDALYIYGGRYALQGISGATQQGFYTYALFLSMIPIAGLTPMITLYMSHMTKLYSTQSILLKNNFLKIFNIAILLYGMFSFCCITNAEAIIRMLGGTAYLAAAQPLKWLAIFSFLNLFDLLSGNLYFCTNRTQSYRMIVNISYLIGIGVLAVFYISHQMSALDFAQMVTLIYALQIAIQCMGNIRFLQLSLNDLNKYFIVPLAGIIIVGTLINAAVAQLILRLSLYAATTLSLGYAIYFYRYKGSLHRI